MQRRREREKGREGRGAFESRSSRHSSRFFTLLSRLCTSCTSANVGIVRFMTTRASLSIHFVCETMCAGKLCYLLTHRPCVDVETRVDKLGRVCKTYRIQRQILRSVQYQIDHIFFCQNTIYDCTFNCVSKNKDPVERKRNSLTS